MENSYEKVSKCSVTGATGEHGVGVDFRIGYKTMRQKKNNAA